jgi:hypothetical protein
MNNQKANNSLFTNIYLWILSVAGAAVCAVSIINLGDEKLDLKFLILAPVTIFFSSYLRIQLPRTKIHLSVSEVLVFYTLFVYGSGAAVLLTGLESLYTSLNLRRQGITIGNKTILF